MNELRCSDCGAVGQASCDCEVPYVPAGEYAAAKVLRYPEMSNRILADRLGVHEKTVRRVRKATAAKAAVEKTVGRDGRKRTAKPKRPEPKPSKAEVIDLDPRRRVLQFRREVMKPSTTTKSGSESGTAPIQISVKTQRNH